MAVLDQTQLDALFADGVLYGITAEKLRDFVDSSMAIGGTLHGLALTQAVTTAWSKYIAYSGSVDTKGLAPTLAEGEFMVEAGAGGVYQADVCLSLTAATAQNIEIAFQRNGSLTPFRSTQRIGTTPTQINLVASGNLAAGDVLGIAIKAASAATLTVVSSQYRLVRV